jgi:cytochrome c-type biogenesis protein CcmE
MKPRILVGIAIIVILAGYLVYAGFQSGQTYYYFCNEIAGLGGSVIDQPIKLHGRVVENSIVQEGDLLRRFDLEYEGARYTVRYVGTDPIPDTFKAGAEAVVDGRMTAAGDFEGSKIQAKCASKYEAQYEVEQSGDPAR